MKRKQVALKAIGRSVQVRLRRSPNARSAPGPACRVVKPAGAAMLVASMLAVATGAVATGCSHARDVVLPSGGGTISGHIEVRVLEDLDYFLPRQTRTAGILVSIRGEPGPRSESSPEKAASSSEKPAPSEKAESSLPTTRTSRTKSEKERFLQLTTDRAGDFVQAGVAPGTYRLAVIRAPGRSDSGTHRHEADIAFPLWESSLEVGMEGVHFERTAEGQLAEAVFEVKEGGHQELGSFVLELRSRPFDGPPTCLIHELLLPGVEGGAYLSSTPVHARLCAVSDADNSAGAGITNH